MTSFEVEPRHSLQFSLVVVRENILSVGLLLLNAQTVSPENIISFSTTPSTLAVTDRLGSSPLSTSSRIPDNRLFHSKTAQITKRYYQTLLITFKKHFVGNFQFHRDRGTTTERSPV